MGEGVYILFLWGGRLPVRARRRGDGSSPPFLGYRCGLGLIPSQSPAVTAPPWGSLEPFSLFYVSQQDFFRRGFLCSRAGGGV